MEKFEYYNPVRLISGYGEVSRIGEEVAAIGKSALLVSYLKPDFINDLLDKVTASLLNAEVKVEEFYEVVANPLVSTAEKGVSVCKQKKIDVVIAVGGGSVMDTAKIIAAGIKYDGDIWNMFYSRHDKMDNIPPTDALPIVTVPTVPATSSEMNSGAVVTNEQLSEKAYVFASCLYPTISILDPQVLVSLPAYQTACGAADAISHCMEIYLNNTTTNPLQYRYLEVITKTILENSKQVLLDPSNLELRATQQWAATVSWNGMTTPGMTGFFPMHTIGHTLSALFGLTHGHTLALIMPAYMRYTWKAIPERYIEFAERILGMNTVDEDKENLVNHAIDNFENHLNELGLKTKLSQVNIPESELENIVEDTLKVYADSGGLIAGVKPLDRTDILNILKIAYQ